MAELHDLTALELAAAIRDGETSPTDVVRHALDRAEALGPQVGAFVTLAPERALAEAREAEAVLRAATDTDALPPLLGVPCPVKDLNAVELVGVYPNYATAQLAWRAKAQQTVDNAEMRYFVVHLHRLLNPEDDEA